MTSPNPKRNPIRTVSAEDVTKSYVGGVARLDADRASAYAGLGTLGAARSAGLRREQRLIARKYGDQHPRVAVVKARADAQAAFQRDLAVATAAAATPAPGVDEDSYVFHGHVRDSRRQPLPGLTIALYRPNGEWISEIGYGCTDENGYFLLRYAQEPGGNRAPKADESADVRVYDRSQKLLHQEAEPLRPQLGAIDYREIILCGRGTCTPPPEAPDNPPPTPVTVPDVVGKPEAAARAAIKEAGLVTESKEKEADAASVGRVLEQNPKAGSLVAAGSVVTIVIGTPRSTVAVPDLAGLTQREAAAVLRKAELALGKVEPTGAPPEARVVQQNPAPGTQADRGTPVDVVVEVPPIKVVVPGVVGMALRDAAAVLKESGLDLGTVEPAGAPLESKVVKQSPAGGTQVDRGTAVNLAVEIPPTRVAVPNLLNLTLAEAMKTLKKADLAVGEVSPPGAPGDSVVVQQSPKAATLVDPGSAVGLVTRETQRKVTVPNVVGRTLPAAKEALAAASLKLGKVNPADAPANTVVARQAPAPGTVVDEGAAVDLELRRAIPGGPQDIVVPTRVAAIKRVPKRKPADG